jgi:hypothetical protein
VLWDRVRFFHFQGSEKLEPRIYIYGGLSSGGDSLSCCYYLNVRTFHWVRLRVDSSARGRYGHTAHLLNCHTMLCLGGTEVRRGFAKRSERVLRSASVLDLLGKVCAAAVYCVSAECEMMREPAVCATISFLSFFLTILLYYPSPPPSSRHVHEDAGRR